MLYIILLVTGIPLLLIAYLCLFDIGCVLIKDIKDCIEKIRK